MTPTQPRGTLPDPAAAGLRAMGPDEAALLASWERAERPYPWTEQHFRETSAWRGVAVAEDPAVGLSGFAALRVVEDEAHLLNLMVNPALRRKGRGGSLLQKVMIWAKTAGASRVLLDVDPANSAAVSLYRAAGFETLERRPRSYPRGEDALIMRKFL